MPKPRIGTIPPTRLSVARRVRDQILKQIGSAGYAVLSIHHGGYSVMVRIFEGMELPKIPGVVDGIPIKMRRVKSSDKSKRG